MNEENHSEEKNKHTTYDDEQTFGSTGKDSTKLIDAVSGLRVGSLLRVWTEISRINYMSTQPLDVITSGSSIRRRSIGLPVKENSMQCFVPSELRNKSVEDLFTEQFPNNVTSLMNEDQLWGCFYTFPELYADVYSPVVRIRNIEDVPELLEGVLTRDMVTACLTYLKRTPILGDFVYIKLDLSSKSLTNIAVLQHYKYLVYLDLSSNLLTELNVLSHLPYLQFLSVAFNRLTTVLEYETPQWFLTEVHYKFNSIKRIMDLSAFWSITILDLSHNNIKGISGLETLRYLRRLDLSFNHIQRFENLNHLRLLWLDISNNNIASFELGPNTGLWTLLHLEYLNVNENNLSSMRFFSDCTRLRELHARNNRLSRLLELAVYMQQLRRLIVLDLRANPVCSSPGYKDVVIKTFPILLSLDAEELDPVDQRRCKMNMAPDVTAFATRRLLRQLYIEQLSSARVSPFVPPADATDVPIVVLVGYEAVGKGMLARRLASQFSSNIVLARQHTTAVHHSSDHYIEISRRKFDDMILAGEFLTYSEMDGESYGLSREEAFIKDGKVRIVSMDLLGALMLKLRGRRPYLILASCTDKSALTKRQQNRKTSRNSANQQRISLGAPLQRSSLQVLLSGRIIITGIINEILLSLPEEKGQSEFLIDSECSLMMDSEIRDYGRNYASDVNLLADLDTSTTSVEGAYKRVEDKNSLLESSIYSIYKESQGNVEHISCTNGQNASQKKINVKKASDVRLSLSKSDKEQKYFSSSGPKSVDFSRQWKADPSMVPDRSKSSKSVTFSSQDINELPKHSNTSAMIIEPLAAEGEEANAAKSISTKLSWPQLEQGTEESISDLELWLAFLIETGVIQNSADLTYQLSNIVSTHNNDFDKRESIVSRMGFYHKTPCESETTNIRDDYESIHRKSPGMFWDTVTMDNPDMAFKKVYRIIKDIVNSQHLLEPMFDVDLANFEHYPTVQKRVHDVCKEIMPTRLFS